MLRSKKLGIVVAGAVAALALGSFAFGAVPDGGGVIHGCFDKQSGHVRVTDTATNLPKACTSKEAALDWNQQGPKGGRGPSDAFLADRLNTLVTANANFATEVVSLTLPPGKYVVSAKLVATASGLNVAPMIAGCALVASGGNGGTADYAYGTVSSGASGNVIVSTLSLANTNTEGVLANGGTVTVRCEAPLPFEARNTQLTAIQVGSISH